MHKHSNSSHALLAAALAATAVSSQAQTCVAKSTAQAAPVVELYTSEGCNSCPPADRWLSALKPDAGVVALAFHVDYWDSLGWRDRFASAAYTQRQAQQRTSNGARYSYTPQIVINGVDRPDWPAVGKVSPVQPAAEVKLDLSRSGEQFTATVQSSSAMRLAAYWAVTENGHTTAVKAGENSGVTLKHDHVVREFSPVAAWSAPAGAPTTLQFRPGVAPNPAQPREVNLVVVNADTGRPVQALKLGC